MLIENILWATGLFFVQPIFIVGLLYAFYTHYKRVKYSREKFRVNFNRSNFEVKNYIIKGLIPGLVVSFILFIVGIPITFEWYLVYQVVAIVLLLIGGSRLIHPIFTFSVTSLLLYSLDYFNIVFDFNGIRQMISTEIFTLNLQTNVEASVMINTLLVSSIVLLISTFTISKNKVNQIFPILGQSKRGKTIAQYPNKMLWVLPMAVIVPGHVIEPFFDWWPLLSIGERTYAILFLPILVGFHYTVSTQLLTQASKNLEKEFKILALFGFVGSLIAYFYPVVLPVVCVILLFLGGLILFRHRKRESLWNFRYGPADEGLRVIAVRPDSPAERLHLSIGDIIMTINDTKMFNHETFDEVIAYNRSYVKMRIKRKDGEIVIAETPLYDDDYNNLGLLVI